MRWSKLRQRIEEKFADSVRGRVHVHATRHHKSAECITRGWITIDGEEVYEASTGRARLQKKRGQRSSTDEEIEVAGWEFAQDLFDYLNMKPAEGFKSGKPVLQAMAVLDSRTGQRTLDKIKEMPMHPLAQRLLALRESVRTRVR